MLGFIANLVGGAIDPLLDRASIFGARLLRKAALFLAAGVCLLVVLIALTIAFDLWISSHFGAIAGALSVAGLYLAAAILAIVLAVLDPKPSRPAAAASSEGQGAEAASDRAEQIDQFTAPLMAMLAKLGLRREQLAVLAGSSLAKRLGPLPLVGLAILAGFLIGRMWKTGRSVFSIDALLGILSSAGLFGFGTTPQEDDEPDAA